VQIEIEVGQGDVARTFNFDKQQLCSTSGFFKNKCRSEPARRHYQLTDYDPVTFNMFVQWLSHGERPNRLYNPAEYSDEPWRSQAVDAWVLARRLQAKRFEQYAFTEFIQNCALSDLDAWKLIEVKSKPHSPLRRFSDHWVAWNVYISAPETSEFSNLNAAARSMSVTSDTRDPRIFDLEHWYSDCSDDLNPSCSHDPIAREATLLEAEQVRPPVPEWGRDLETLHNQPAPQPQPPRPVFPQPLNSSPNPQPLYSSPNPQPLNSPPKPTSSSSDDTPLLVPLIILGVN
jgi:hypothetical protein